MKFYLIFISLLFFNNSIYTQVNKYLISTDKTRVIYRGIDNPISISCDGCLDKLKVSIEGESSTIKKINDGQYLINTKEYLNNFITIIVYDGSDIQKTKMPVRDIPDPIALVGRSTGGNMRAPEFRIQQGVFAGLFDFFYEGYKSNVVSYTITGKGVGFEIPETAEVIGAVFDNSAKFIIRRCQPGTIVTIGEIKVLMPGGETRKLNQVLTFYLQ